MCFEPHLTQMSGFCSAVGLLIYDIYVCVYVCARVFALARVLH
jgi:hypothetical protein